MCVGGGEVGGGVEVWVWVGMCAGVLECVCVGGGVRVDVCMCVCCTF